jgi:hypothetical protein
VTPIERKLHRAAVENRKERLSGIHNEGLPWVWVRSGSGQGGRSHNWQQARGFGLATLPALSSQAERTPARGASADPRLAQCVRGHWPMALVGR